MTMIQLTFKFYKVNRIISIEIKQIQKQRLLYIQYIFRMDNSPNSPLPPSLHKRPTALNKKLSKLLKQQQNTGTDKHVGNKEFHPGKVQITASQKCKPRVVNFFGDLNTQIFCLHTSQDDQYVASGCDNGDVRIYNIYTGNILMLSNSSRMNGYPNTGIRWRPKSTRELTACNSDGTIKWYDRQKQAVTAQHDAQVGYLCTDYNCNGDWSVYGNQKYQIQVYDAETKKNLVKYDAGSVECWEPNHVNRIFCVKGVKKQPNLFFSGGWDSTVRLWDVRRPNQFVRKFYGPSVSSESLDLRGNTLLVGNYANKEIVQLWDFGSGKLIQTLDLKQKQLGGAYCLCAGYAHKSKYDLYAVGLTGVNKVKIFQGRENVADIQLQAAPLALHFYQYNNKDFMVTGGVQGTVYVMKIKIIQN